MTQALDSATVTFDLQKYIHQLKPLNIEKARKAQPNDKATPKEQSQLRGLLGGLAWPANQTQLHLAASVSLAQAASACATVSELLEGNKTLRYAKESSDVHLFLRGHGRLEEIRFGIYSDASWCTRPDGSSQGGWITFVATEAEIGGNKPFPLTVIDWSSRKLTRVCRSSLSAEAQTLAAAIDSLEWTKTVFALMIWPALRPDNEEMMLWLGDSPCITDARALFDASNSKAPGMKLAEKRTAIEIKMACERMAAAGGVLKWCNSHQQLADGVTKVSARQKLAMELRRRMHCLRYDPEGTASKKVKQNVRQDEQDSLDQAAQEFQKQQMVKDGIYKIEEMESEEKMECNICLLDGCGLPAEDGKRFCSKRHYHAAKHKQSKTSSNKSTGVIWCMTLANEIVPVAALEFGFVIFLSFDKIIGFFFFLAVALVFSYTLGKRAGRREAHDLMAATEPTETAEEEVQAPQTLRARARTDCQRFTAGEIGFLVSEGYDVWSDELVEQIRQDFLAELPPSMRITCPKPRSTGC